MMIFGPAIGGPAVLSTVCWILLGVIPVRVSTNDGELVEGMLGQLTTSELTVQKQSGDIKLSFDRLATLQHTAAGEQTPPTYTVVLLNGSRVMAPEISLADETLMIEPRRQKSLPIDVKQVKSIRFRPSSATTDPQWLGLLEREGAGDLMAIRREGDRLDPYQGIVGGIRQGVVAFDLDGTAVNAPIEKLEGVVFGGNRPVAEDAPIRIEDIYGSQWAVREITPTSAGEPLRMTLGDGVQHELPLEQLLSIRWSSGLQSLAALPPAARNFETLQKTKLPSSLLRDWFAPNAEGDSDLILRGNGSVEYRVEPGFSTLSGSVGREASIRQAGELVVTIFVDDESQWQETIRGDERLGFELPIDSARRIRFQTDCGGDGDLGDTIRIRRPRFVK